MRDYFVIETNDYPEVSMVKSYDPDTNEEFYDMYQGAIGEDGGYLGEYHGNLDEGYLTEDDIRDIDEQIDENLNY